MLKTTLLLAKKLALGYSILIFVDPVHSAFEVS